MIVLQFGSKYRWSSSQNLTLKLAFELQKVTDHVLCLNINILCLHKLMIQNFKFVFIDLGLGYLHVLQCQYKKKSAQHWSKAEPLLSTVWSRSQCQQTNPLTLPPDRLTSSFGFQRLSTALTLLYSCFIPLDKWLSKQTKDDLLRRPFLECTGHTLCVSAKDSSSQMSQWNGACGFIHATSLLYVLWFLLRCG